MNRMLALRMAWLRLIHPTPSTTVTATTDQLRVTAIIGGFVALLGVLIAFMARFSLNLPMQDEWAYVKTLFAPGVPIAWFFEPHHEHRYTVGRIIYWCLLRGSGGNFQAGNIASLFILGISAILALRAAYRLRGFARLTDIGFAALLLNASHAENLMMGYQIVFTLTTGLAVAMLYLMATSEHRSPERTARLAGWLLVPITLGGGFGLVIAGPLTLWLLGTLLFAVGQRTILLVVPPILCLAYSLWAISSTLLNPSNFPKTDWGDVPWHAVEFLSIGLGQGMFTRWPIGGVVVAQVYLVAMVGLLDLAWRKPTERVKALGFFAVILGVVLASVAIARNRPLMQELRYTTISCVGLVAIGLAATAYLRIRHLNGLVSLLLLGFFAWLTSANYEAGKRYAFPYKVRYEHLMQDLRDQVRLEYLIERNIIFPTPEYAESCRVLHAKQLTPLSAATDQNCNLNFAQYLNIDIRDNEPKPGDRGEPIIQKIRFQPEFLRSAHVRVVQIEYESKHARYWQDYRLSWTSKADPDRVVHTSRVIPWIIPGKGVLTFIIGGTIDELWLESLAPTPGLKLTRIQFLS